MLQQSSLEAAAIDKVVSYLFPRLQNFLPTVPATLAGNKSLFGMN